jgi:hypothetical protein
MNDLSDALSGYNSVGCSRDDGDEQGEYAALFYSSEEIHELFCRMFPEEKTI